MILNNDNIQMTEIVELTYTRFSSYYSAKNWLYEWPLWANLSKEDKDFWVAFVKGVQNSFGLTAKKPEKPDLPFLPSAPVHKVV
jgi:hypothetical protein